MDDKPPETAVANNYDLIAPFYDVSQSELGADLDYILRLAGKEPVSILDIGCGSGRLAIPLATAGHAVTGIDSSQAMLQLARDRARQLTPAARQRLQLRLGDMARLDRIGLAGPYGLALYSHNTFWHLSPDAKGGSLSQLRPLLGGAGKLFLDLVNPAQFDVMAEEEPLAVEEIYDPPDGALRQGETAVTHYASYQIDRAAQLMRVTHEFEREAERVSAEFVFHYLYAHQVELLLADSGYKMIGMAGGYEGEAYAEDSPRLLVVARPLARGRRF